MAMAFAPAIRTYDGGPVADVRLFPFDLVLLRVAISVASLTLGGSRSLDAYRFPDSLASTNFG